MTKSDNQEVQELLNSIKLSSRVHYEILQQLRSVVLTELPAVTERVMYGGIMFTLMEDFGGIYSYKNHVSFEFAQAYRFRDPNACLEGSGKMRRHLKIESLSDIETKKVSYYIKQAVELVQ